MSGYDYDDLIRKVTAAQDCFYKVGQKLADLVVLLGDDFEDTADYANSLETLMSFGCQEAARLRANLEDEKLDNGGD